MVIRVWVILEAHDVEINMLFVITNPKKPKTYGPSF